jgi:hypothetical protein
MLKRYWLIMASALLLSACGQDCANPYNAGYYNPNCAIANGYQGAYPNPGYYPTNGTNLPYPNGFYPQGSAYPTNYPANYPSNYPVAGYPNGPYPYPGTYYPNTPGVVCTPNNPFCYH